MKTTKPLPELEILNRLFEYDHVTGRLLWRVRNCNRAEIGSEAGTITNSGYIHVAIGKRRCLAHRVAYKLHHGVEPPIMLDHINGDRTDNRICNLRPSTSSLNAANKRRSKRSTSGVKGVSWDKRTKRWTARIMVNGNALFLGRFHRIQDAQAAYAIAAKQAFGEYCRVEDAVPVVEDKPVVCCS